MTWAGCCVYIIPTVAESKHSKLLGAEMQIRIVTVAAAVLLGFLHLSEALSLPNVNCCTEVSQDITDVILERVLGFELQESDGICNLRAVRLYTRRKTLCANPDHTIVKNWMEQKRDVKPKKKGAGRKEIRQQGKQNNRQKRKRQRKQKRKRKN
ncbi:C-C motif chemokine 28 [Ascaphus truei]|uniref:C-C motif chemokine 28 n=1 Tax=Ascaphus truei TaxID=8439 RepID=UPI003F59DBAA